MDPAIEPDFANSTAGSTAGFTLIELLVCVAILSVLAFGASLALPRGSSAAMRDMALFQRHYAQQRQQAINGQNSAGIALDPKGMRLAHRQPEAMQLVAPSGTRLQRDLAPPLIWQVSPRQIRWQGRVTFSSPIDASAPVQIQFLADGRSSAFVVRFSSGTAGTGGQASCRSDGWTGLTCKSS